MPVSPFWNGTRWRSASIALFVENPIKYILYVIVLAIVSPPALLKTYWTENWDSTTVIWTKAWICVNSRFLWIHTNCPIWFCVELGFSRMDLFSGACSRAVSLLLFLAKTSLQMSCIWLSILYVCSAIATCQVPPPLLNACEESTQGHESGPLFFSASGSHYFCCEYWHLTLRLELKCWQGGV